MEVGLKQLSNMWPFGKKTPKTPETPPPAPPPQAALKENTQIINKQMPAPKPPAAELKAPGVRFQESSGKAEGAVRFQEPSGRQDGSNRPPESRKADGGVRFQESAPRPEPSGRPQLSANSKGEGSVRFQESSGKSESSVRFQEPNGRQQVVPTEGSLSRSPRSLSPGSQRTASPRTTSPINGGNSMRQRKQVTIQDPSSLDMDEVLKDDDNSDSYQGPVSSYQVPTRTAIRAPPPPSGRAATQSPSSSRQVESRAVGTPNTVLSSMVPLEGREFENPNPLTLYTNGDKPLSPMLFQTYNVKRTVNIRLYNIGQPPGGRRRMSGNNGVAVR